MISGGHSLHAGDHDVRLQQVLEFDLHVLLQVRGHDHLEVVPHKLADLVLPLSAQMAGGDDQVRPPQVAS